MTIHKAKGLQFPFVVLPFLSSDFQPSFRIKRQVWYPIEFENTSVNFGRINFSSRLETYSEKSKEIFDNDKKENELDALNNLYVAMTRAEAKMVIITSIFEKLKAKKNYSQLFHQFLKKNGAAPDLNRPYLFGSKDCFYIPNRNETLKKDSIKPIFNFQWKNRLINKDSTNSLTERGVKVHILFSKIENLSDVDLAIDFCIKQGFFKIENKFELKNLVNEVISHHKLKKVFEIGNKIYNEKDILIPKKGLIRPDKVVFTETACYVIDYKTGKPKPDDNIQIKNYSNYLESITSSPIISYLVYINETVIVKNIPKYE
jgi:ATP-dependent exoDNAse (exonuclease V) beta subunit